MNIKKTVGGISVVAVTVATSATSAASADYVELTAPANAEASDVNVTSEGPGETKEGEELFTALYFATGDSVTEVQEAVESDEYDEFVDFLSDDPEADALSSDVISRISESDSGFFSSFHQDMRSGDPYQVQDALIQASELTEESLNEIAEEILDDPEIKQQVDTVYAANDELANPEAAAVAVAAAVLYAAAVWDAAAAVNYAVVVNAGAAVNAVAAVNAAVAVNSSNSSAEAAKDPASRNQFEERVATLTDSLER